MGKLQARLAAANELAFKGRVVELQQILGAVVERLDAMEGLRRQRESQARSQLAAAKSINRQLRWSLI